MLALKLERFQSTSAVLSNKIELNTFLKKKKYKIRLFQSVDPARIK